MIYNTKYCISLRDKGGSLAEIGFDALVRAARPPANAELHRRQSAPHFSWLHSFQPEPNIKTADATISKGL
jgi:hypothetical protein